MCDSGAGVYQCEFSGSTLQITSCSQKFAQLLGYENAQPLMEHATVLDLFCPESLNTIQSLLMNKAASEGASGKLQRQGMTELDVLMSINKGVGGLRTLTFVPVAKHSDDFSRLQREFKKTQERNTQLADYTQLIIHDLKSSIQIISNIVELSQLRENAILSDAMTSGLTQIQSETHRMNRMLTGMRQYARTDIGEYPAELANLNTLVEKIAAHLSGASERLIRIRRKNELPSIHCRVALIEELMHNLFENAIFYNDSPCVEITVRSDTGEDGAITIFVKDNGIGISEKDIARVLQPGQRADPALRNAGGTGMGLSLARRIVEKHDGLLQIHSAPDNGTTVQFTLHEFS